MKKKLIMINKRYIDLLIEHGSNCTHTTHERTIFETGRKILYFGDKKIHYFPKIS